VFEILERGDILFVLLGLGERILREEKEMREMKRRLLAIEADLQALYRESGEESTEVSLLTLSITHVESRIPYYANGIVTFQLLLKSGDVAEDPGPEQGKPVSQQLLRNSAPACHQCNDKTFRHDQKCFICTVCEDATHARCARVVHIYPLPMLKIGLTRPSFQYCRFFGQDILDLSVSSCGSGDVSYLLALQRNNMNLHGSYNLEKVLTFTSCLEKSLNLV